MGSSSEKVLAAALFALFTVPACGSDNDPAAPTASGGENTASGGAASGGTASGGTASGGAASGGAASGGKSTGGKSSGSSGGAATSGATATSAGAARSPTAAPSAGTWAIRPGRGISPRTMRSCGWS